MDASALTEDFAPASLDAQSELDNITPGRLCAGRSLANEQQKHQPQGTSMKYGMVVVGGALLLLLSFPACQAKPGSEFLGTWKLIRGALEDPNGEESIEREVARKLKRRFGINITSDGTTHVSAAEHGAVERIVITRNGEQYLVTLDDKHKWGASYKDGGLNIGGIAQITHIKASDHITLQGAEYSRLK